MLGFPSAVVALMFFQYCRKLNFEFEKKVIRKEQLSLFLGDDVCACLVSDDLECQGGDGMVQHQLLGRMLNHLLGHPRSPREGQHRKNE